VSDAPLPPIADFDPRPELSVWLERAQRRGERHGLALLAGHGAWSAEVDAQSLSAVLRDGDRIWIWRGSPDRVVLLLTGVGDLPTAADVVRRLVSGLAEPQPNAGVALLQPGEGVDSLLRRVEGAWLLATDEAPGHVATSPVLGAPNAR